MLNFRSKITLIATLALVTGVIIQPTSAQESGTPVPIATPTAVASATTTIMRASVTALPPAPLLIGIGQWVLQPGSSASHSVPGPAIYAVQNGTLSVRVDGAAELVATESGATPAPAVATPGVDYTLRPGDQITIASGAAHTLRNDGEVAVELLNAVAFPASSGVPSWLGEPAYPAGVHFRTLAMDIVDDQTLLPSGPTTMGVTRLVISPGEAPRQIDAVTFDVLVVESGDVVVRDGGETRLARGDIIRLAAGSTPTLANESDQPATLLRLSVAPGQ